MKSLIDKLLLKNFWGPVSILVLMLLLLHSGVGAVESDGCMPFKTILDDLDKDLFYGAVFVAKDEKPLCKKGFGYIDKENIVEWNEHTMMDTQVNIASMTKYFTANIIMNLEKEGRLKLSDRIDKHLTWYKPSEIQGDCYMFGSEPRPPCIPNNGQITIHNLLEMSSGLPNPDFFMFEQGNIKNDILNYCSSSKLCFEPGTQGNYNNGDPYILGAIIAKILTGKDYWDWETKYKSYRNGLRKYIFNKRDMESSGYYDRPTNLATGYYWVGERFVPASKIYIENRMRKWYSVAGAYSTIGDLFTWSKYIQKILDNNDHPDRKMVDQMFEGKIHETGAKTCLLWGKNIYNGYGAFIAYYNPKTNEYTEKNEKSIKLIILNGLLIPYTTTFVIIPEKNYSIIVTNNNSKDLNLFIGNTGTYDTTTAWITRGIIKTLLYKGDRAPSFDLPDM